MLVVTAVLATLLSVQPNRRVRDRLPSVVQRPGADLVHELEPRPTPCLTQCHYRHRCDVILACLRWFYLVDTRRLYSDDLDKIVDQVVARPDGTLPQAELSSAPAQGSL